ncbi:zcchc10 protein [Anaeramoeba flamelloides]|uniref:Zcchc10 protein n=1 Tax=Anaeramoeba flamelloides TaxID=1746091 RepID=A0ABQ8XSY7_9EUKA|nr:zcchc10 protein [Anaeramoeba flamelloides]
MSDSTILATHGGCYLENLDREDYQCMCKFMGGFKPYRYIFLSTSIITFLITLYLLIDVWRMINKNRKLFSVFKLKILSLGISFLFTIISVVYYSYDPHRCNREINPVLESVLYGLGICLPAILLVMIILRWLDLLKASFSQQKHALFKPATKKIFFSVMVFWLLFEIICRVFWAGSTYYIYSIWGCLYTIVCFIGYVVVGTKLNRKLLYGGKLAGSIDEKRKNQIKQIYTVALIGSLVSILIFLESLIAMVISCFNQAKCSLAIEFLWKFEESTIIWIYIWIAWKGNNSIKNQKNPKQNSQKKNKNTDQIKKNSDIEVNSLSSSKASSSNKDSSDSDKSSNSKDPNDSKGSTGSKDSSDSLESD